MFSSSSQKFNFTLDDAPSMSFLPASSSVPRAMTMQQQIFEVESIPQRIPSFLQRDIKAVFLCFYTPKGAKSSTRFGQLVDYVTSMVGERFNHVECLFDRGGDIKDPERFHALNVSSKDVSGCYTRTLDYYRDCRWVIYQLRGLSLSQKQTMYLFTRKESSKQRGYNYGSTLSTTPGINCLLPICTYTPGLSRCMPSGKDTVFCVQLIAEMMKLVYAKELIDLRTDSMRPDVFLAQMLSRLPSVVQVALTLETQSEAHMTRTLLRDAGTDLWEPPH